MTCAELEDRLFDEDCRAALLGRDVVPGDVAEHVAHCSLCARRWAESSADTQQLLERLVAAPPPALLHRLYGAVRPQARVTLRPQARPRTLRIDTDGLAWAVAAGVLGAILAGGGWAPTGAREWAGFCVGASLGLTAVALRSASHGWLAPLGLLRSAAVRSIDRLARVI